MSILIRFGRIDCPSPKAYYNRTLSVIEFNYMFETNEASAPRVQQLAATAKAFILI